MDTGHPTEPARYPWLHSRAWLAGEWLVLFVGFPVLAWVDPFGWRIFPYFIVPVLYTLLLYRCVRHNRVRKRDPYRVLGMQLRWFVCFPLIFAIVWFVVPLAVLFLPQEMPDVYFRVLMLYPFFSALPQEFIYRQFYFARYQALFPNTWLMAAGNIAVFGLLHLPYGWKTVLLSLVAGAFFTSTYLKSGRLSMVWLEHTLYGWLIFASGLGIWFYKPA